MQIDPLGDLSTETERSLGKLVKQKYGTDFYIVHKYVYEHSNYETGCIDTLKRICNTHIYVRFVFRFAGTLWACGLFTPCPTQTTLGTPTRSTYSYVAKRSPAAPNVFTARICSKVRVRLREHVDVDVVVSRFDVNVCRVYSSSSAIPLDRRTFLFCLCCFCRASQCVRHSDSLGAIVHRQLQVRCTPTRRRGRRTGACGDAVPRPG